LVFAVAQLGRVKAGLTRAKENGKKLGRQRVKIDRENIFRLRSQGLSLRELAIQTGISRTTVHDILKGRQWS